MKKTITKLFTLILTVGLVAYTANAQTGYPYFPESEVANDITTVASVVDNPSTALVDLTGNFTIQVSGTAGTEIKISNGSIYYAYTPTADGEVRFVKKNGTVHVYEGANYKNTIASQSAISYPVLTETSDKTEMTNPAQLLQNASFEILGDLKTGFTDRWNYGTPWVTNTTANTGIRVMANANTVDGSKLNIWRGSGNDSYFAQPIEGIKANTSYKVIIRQITSGNANAKFNVGFGSTVSGLEYGSGTINLGTTYDGVRTATFTTNNDVTGTVYFTFSNTLTNTASSGNDPVAQLDYIWLVEGSVSIPQGIVGAAGNVYYVANAFSPQVTVNYLAGDFYDMTSLITNPSFESNFTGWTNSSMATQTNVPGQGWTKNGNVYVEKWVSSSGNLPVVSVMQTVTGLMNGAGYKLTASAHSIKQGAADPTATTGTYLYAGTLQVLVNAGKDYTVENIEVTDNSLAVGFKTEGTITANWAGVDNFRLTYHSNVANVSFVANGGSAVATQYVTKGEKTGEPVVPTKAGFNFGGWYIDAALTNAWDFNTIVTADVVLYAKWIEMSHVSTLTDLKVSDISVTGFDAATLTYNVVLPEGTSSVPVVTAVTTDAKAQAVVTPANALPGSTTVVVTAEDGVSATTYTINFTVAVGVNDPESEAIKVYPSVTNDVFHVKFANEPGEIQVYSLAGNLIYEIQASSNDEKVQIEQAGTYILKIKGQGTVKTVKVIKLK